MYQYLFRLLNNSWVAGGNPPSQRPPVGARTTAAAATSGAPTSPPPSFPVPRPSELGARRDSKSSAASFASTSKALSSTETLGEVDLNNHLTEIFAKIGSPLDSKKGISELYQLMKMHPEAHAKVDKWISATGTYFQAYLRRALNNLKADDPDPPKAIMQEGMSSSISAAARLSTASQVLSPTQSAFSSGVGGVGSRMTKSQSQDVDLSRLQSLFGFEAISPTPTCAEQNGQ